MIDLNFCNAEISEIQSKISQRNQIEQLSYLGKVYQNLKKHWVNGDKNIGYFLNFREKYNWITLRLKPSHSRRKSKAWSFNL